MGLGPLPPGRGRIDADQFTDALERVADGGTASDPAVIAKLLGTPVQAGPAASPTERERAVLALMAEGLSNSAIAARLYRTERGRDRQVHDRDLR